MTRYVQTDIGTGYNSSTSINTELSKVETAFADTISRSGDVPNSMQSDLDMNSNQILNLPVPTTSGEPLRLADVGLIGYSHPTYDGNDFDVDTTALTGATVVSDIDIRVDSDSEGHVVVAECAIATRTLTPSDIGAVATTGAETIAGVKTFSSDMQFTGDLSISASSKLYFDGGDHTYIEERVGGEFLFVTSSSDAFGVSNRGIGVIAGERVYLDGIGTTGNTYIEESSPNNLTLVAGGDVKINLNSTTGATGGSGSAGSGNNYVELNIGGTRYKLLHDGTL